MKGADYWLPTPFASFPFTSPPARHRVPPDSACALPIMFPCGKLAGVWHLTPIPSSTKVKERVQLRLYPQSGTSWPLMGWTLRLLPYKW